MRHFFAGTTRRRGYKTWHFFVWAGLCCAVLGACGSSNQPGGQTPKTPTAQASSVQASPAQTPGTQGQSLRVFVLDPAILLKTKQALAHDSTLQAALHQLQTQADELLKKQPVSVMEKTQLPASGDKHDYLSLAPYYWPDPSKPDGLPYINRDGQVNPEVNTIPDKSNYGKMESSVRTLAYAYFFSGKEQYASKAADFLRTWFLNKDTYMKPNLNYAQMVKGANNGRSIGIIDMRNFALLTDAIGLLQGSTSWTAQDQQRMQQWFSQYLDWLLNSPNGKEEGNAKNNHGTWYDVQAAAIAFFVDKSDVARSILQASSAKHIDGHINANGLQPSEVDRTRSWHYHVFNLDALFEVASLGDKVGLDIWKYKNPQGAGLQSALNFVLPAALGQQTWPYQEIGGVQPTELDEILYQAANHYHNAQYRQNAQSFEGKGAPTSLNQLLYGDNAS